MRQAGQQQHHLLRLPPALPAGHQAQGLFVLAEGRFNPGAAIIGIGQRGRLHIEQSRYEDGILIAPFLLGRGMTHCRVVRQKRWGCRTGAISRPGLDVDCQGPIA